MRVAAQRGLTFADASSVFLDPLALTVSDPAHSTLEARYATIGTTRTNKLVVVVHTDRDQRIRIITAWPATPGERRTYERQSRR